MTFEDAAAIVGRRYGGRYAFYDTAAAPEFAAESADPSLWRLRELESDPSRSRGRRARPARPLALPHPPQGGTICHSE